MHGMLMEMAMAMKTVYPMSIVRDPKRWEGVAKMGVRSADAMFAERKLHWLEWVSTLLQF